MNGNLSSDSQLVALIQKRRKGLPCSRATVGQNPKCVQRKANPCRRALTCTLTLSQLRSSLCQCWSLEDFSPLVVVQKLIFESFSSCDGSTVRPRNSHSLGPHNYGERYFLLFTAFAIALFPRKNSTSTRIQFALDWTFKNFSQEDYESDFQSDIGC